MYYRYCYYSQTGHVRNLALRFAALRRATYAAEGGHQNHIEVQKYRKKKLDNEE